MNSFKFYMVNHTQLLLNNAKGTRPYFPSFVLSNDQLILQKNYKMGYSTCCKPFAACPKSVYPQPKLNDTDIRSSSARFIGTSWRSQPSHSSTSPMDGVT